MTPEEFIQELKEQISKDEEPFIRNMNHINKKDDTFCEWIKIFSAWMEWAEGDCEQYHEDFVIE